MMDNMEVSPGGDHGDTHQEGNSRAANDSQENKLDAAQAQAQSAFDEMLSEAEADGNQGAAGIFDRMHQEAVDAATYTPVPYDLAAISEYVRMRHILAAGLRGKFILMAMSPEQKVRGIHHFKVGQIDLMYRTIASYCPVHGTRAFTHGVQPINLYCPLALFHENIPRYGKGSGGREMDVVFSFAAVGDQDNYKREGKPLPFEPSCLLETSPGSYHAWFVYPQPLPFAKAKQTLLAFNRLTGDDNAEKDVSHIWRIAGTLNWPTAAKIARGRSPVPFLVNWRIPRRSRRSANHHRGCAAGAAKGAARGKGSCLQ